MCPHCAVLLKVKLCRIYAISDDTRNNRSCSEFVCNALNLFDLSVQMIYKNWNGSPSLLILCIVNVRIIWYHWIHGSDVYSRTKNKTLKVLTLRLLNLLTIENRIVYLFLQIIFIDVKLKQFIKISLFSLILLQVSIEESSSKLIWSTFDVGTEITKMGNRKSKNLVVKASYKNWQ